MTFPAIEASAFGGKPVTLYKFLLSASEGFPDAPAAPGGLVAVVPLQDYIMVRDAGQTSLGPCPPTSPASAICGDFPDIGFGEGITVWSAYHGGLAGSGAFFYARYDLTEYIEPSHDYIVRMLGRKLGGGSPHVSGGRVVTTVPGTVNSFSSSWEYHDFPVTSGPAGELDANVGGFDMTVGAAIITGLAFLAIYDAELPSSGTPGLETTQFNRTSFRRSVVYQGLTYRPSEIEHTEPSQGVDDAPGTIQITLPGNDPLAVEFQSSIPPAQPMVVVYQYHRPPVDEPDDADVRATLFDIVNVEHQPKVTIFTCASIIGQGDILIPTGLIQREQCMFNTYDPLTCGVDPADFTFEGVVALIDGLSVTVTGAGTFNADPAFFQYGAFSKGTKSTMIAEQDGDIMVLDEMLSDLIVGDSVRLLAGDDRKRITCHEKFNNVARYFGFENMPVSNPFYGQGLRP